MALSNIDGKTMALAALASLVGYVFYGFIELQALVDTVVTKQEQVIGEQRDLWGKFNNDQADKFTFATEFWQFKVQEAEDKAAARNELMEFKVEYYKSRIK